MLTNPTSFQLPDLVIEVSGGVVQEVWLHRRFQDLDITCQILDHDSEDEDPDGLTLIEENPDTYITIS